MSQCSCAKYTCAISELGPDYRYGAIVIKNKMFQLLEAFGINFINISYATTYHDDIRIQHICDGRNCFAKEMTEPVKCMTGIWISFFLHDDFLQGLFCSGYGFIKFLQGRTGN